MSVLAETYKFTVEDFYRLHDTGILNDKDRIELLNGELIIMHAIGFRHMQAVTNFGAFFSDAARRRFMNSPQNPLRLDDQSQPQPDIVLVPWKPKRPSGPTPDEIFLIVEVSDTSLRYDRNDKLRAYARSGVREVWIVNLVDDVVEVHRLPEGNTYRESAVFGIDASIAPLAFPDVVLQLAEVMPAR